MKKLLSIVLCAAVVSAFGEETAERTADLGTVGVTAITSSLSNTIVAVSYDDLALASGSGIVVSNFVKTTNLTVDDQLAIFNNGLYDTWTLKEKEDAGGVKVKYWDKNEQTYTVGPDGKLVVGKGTSAAVVSRSVGTGIWLVRQNPTDKDRKAIPFYIYGKSATTQTSSTVGGNWTLVGNPKQVEVNLGRDKVGGARTGDQIVAVDENGIPRYYTFKSGCGWQANVGGNAVLLPPIGAGLGVWILTAENATISW